ncbi:MAG: hypothetical protein EOO73_11150 [Myxococcales bacterium]|nr:MAG: hypothetical protein EOO73_11150 [Myxococcales bacterium]
MVSVLYHALQGNQACEQYIKDAQEASDDERMKFFVESRDEQDARANRAKLLLSERMDVEEEEGEDEG